MKHPQAENMMLYAQDAMETDKPWERWQYAVTGEGWFDISNNPSWVDNYEYRRKPRTIKVNGFDVPAPETAMPADRVEYYSPNISSYDFYSTSRCYKDSADVLWLSRGLIHLTKENAIAHAKAMCGIDPWSKE